MRVTRGAALGVGRAAVAVCALLWTADARGQERSPPPPAESPLAASETLVASGEAARAAPAGCFEPAPVCGAPALATCATKRSDAPECAALAGPLEACFAQAAQLAGDACAAPAPGALLSEASDPAAVIPDAPDFDAPNPDAPNPDAPNPDAPNPDAASLDASSPDAAKLARLCAADGVLWPLLRASLLPEALDGLARACADRPAGRLAAIRARTLRAGPDLGLSRPRFALRPGEIFIDCSDCPVMVVLPPGRFRRGSPPDEPGRQADEGPARAVDVPAIAVARTEITRADYAVFVEATGYVGDGPAATPTCRTFEDGVWAFRTGRDWRDPGFSQTPEHPVVCVSWRDARAYVAWLNAMVEGAPYRLPSAAEWEYAARAGADTAFPWGETLETACDHANLYDQTSAARNRFDWPAADCQDGWAHTAAAGWFRPNEFKLLDMIGNVWEWTDDCWIGALGAARGDSRAAEAADGGDCRYRGLRGGAWDFKPITARAANRNRVAKGYRGAFIGFRVARDMPGGPEP